MVRDKVRCVAATGAEVLVCNDGGCAMNIAGACRRMGVNVRVTHVVELLDEALAFSTGGTEPPASAGANPRR